MEAELREAENEKSNRDFFFRLDVPFHTQVDYGAIWSDENKVKVYPIEVFKPHLFLHSARLLSSQALAVAWNTLALDLIHKALLSHTILNSVKYEGNKITMDLGVPPILARTIPPRL